MLKFEKKIRRQKVKNAISIPHSVGSKVKMTVNNEIRVMWKEYAVAELEEIRCPDDLSLDQEMRPVSLQYTEGMLPTRPTYLSLYFL